MKDLVAVLDIGTTTIKGLLLDKSSGKNITTGFVLNEQVKFGEDVISRIGYSIKDPKNADILQAVIIRSINKLIKKLVYSTPFKTGDINEIFAVCNTAMYFLLLGLSAECLINPPYKTALQKTETVLTSKELGLKIFSKGSLTILPNIGGFVGSDAIAFIIASGIYKNKNMQLGVDIGTNDEIILGSANKIMVTSTAAGPAFEGRYISCGMPAIEGAIEKVYIQKNKNVKISVVGNAQPKGICGSGLIDAVAQMFLNGFVDRTGKMQQERFELFKGKSKSIYITQEDIRKLQLAKAAIYAGIKVLTRQLDIEITDIKNIFITGSFGNSLNVKSAILTGLIPKINADKITVLKDAPLAGVKMYVLSKDIQKQLTSILSVIKRAPLTRKDFFDTYADSMWFGS